MEDDELRLIWLYCWLDGVVGAVTGEVGRLRERGPAPKLTDAEVLTIMIWGEILGLPSDARSGGPPSRCWWGGSRAWWRNGILSGAAPT